MGDEKRDEAIRLKAYYQGVKQGIWLYAWWKDGAEFVGTTGTRLADAHRKIDLEEQEAQRRNDFS